MGDTQQAQRPMFITDDEIADRLRELEGKLLTAQAMIPGMVREIQTLLEALHR